MDTESRYGITINIFKKWYCSFFSTPSGMSSAWGGYAKEQIFMFLFDFGLREYHRLKIALLELSVYGIALFLNLFRAIEILSDLKTISGTLILRHAI
jgi:hypothetical protein